MKNCMKHAIRMHERSFCIFAMTCCNTRQKNCLEFPKDFFCLRGATKQFQNERNRFEELRKLRNGAGCHKTALTQFR